MEIIRSLDSTILCRRWSPLKTYRSFDCLRNRHAARTQPVCPGHSLSQEIEIRLRQSLLRRANAPVHVGALLYGMSLLVDEIERDTGKRFIDDAFTGEAVRSALESLIYHFAQRPTGPFQVPADVDRMASKMQSSLQAPLRDPSMFGQTKAGLYITLIENARSPDEIAGRVLRPDRWGFWQILSDLGSGWQRNRKSRNKGAQP